MGRLLPPRGWRFLRCAVGMVRAGFGMSWLRTLLGAWLVLRANQKWAPYPDNDPDAACRFMRRFYQQVVRATEERFDVDEAARLEVEWWRAHRELQRERGGKDGEQLIDALAALYAHVYGIPAEEARPAARCVPPRRACPTNGSTRDATRRAL